MAGKILNEDLERLRERVRIEDIIGQHVLLKPAGVGSLKGLCPFHDERTPSFHVRPAQGFFHCFGCGVGGDAIAFVQNYHHLSFTEAVEYLADRYNLQLRYEQSSNPSPTGPKKLTRQRLLAANLAAQQFFVESFKQPEAKLGLDFLHARKFTDAHIAQFGVGYAPDSWSALLDYLRKNGFTEAELGESGLFSRGQRGIYDRFRGRLIWPIRDLTGAIVGFGARRLKDDDDSPKYLNTPETAVYKKSQVLYGIEMARKVISTQRRLVVVEGYTDVMAAHLSGVECAVATCGTAFGEGHVRIARRLLGDSASYSSGVILSDGTALGGEVIFTFDGDEAGQKAALRAFKEDQSFAAQTFVAVDQEGRDPCDIYQQEGPAGVQALLQRRQPLFEFVLKTILRNYNLDRPEGRVAGLRAAAPIIKGIRDRALQGEYLRQLQGWVALPEEDVRRAVSAARVGVASERISAVAEPGSLQPEPNVELQVMESQDPTVRLERSLLSVVLQMPAILVNEPVDIALAGQFYTPVFAAIASAILSVGGVAHFTQIFSEQQSHHTELIDSIQAANKIWLEQIKQAVNPSCAAVLGALVVAPLPESNPERLNLYCLDILRAFRRQLLSHQIADVRSQLTRTLDGSPEQQQLFAQLMQLETQKRTM